MANAECRVVIAFSIYLCCSINFRICGAGIAPAWRAILRPFRNKVIVGIAVTRKRYPRVGTSSVFTFATGGPQFPSLPCVPRAPPFCTGHTKAPKNPPAPARPSGLLAPQKRGHCEHRQVQRQARVRFDIGRIGKSCPNLRISSGCGARILDSSIKFRAHRVRSF